MAPRGLGYEESVRSDVQRALASTMSPAPSFINNNNNNNNNTQQPTAPPPPPNAQPATNAAPVSTQVTDAISGSFGVLRATVTSVMQYAHTQLFAAIVCFLIVLLMLVWAQPPFVQEAHSHALDNAPVSLTAVLAYSALAAGTMLAWPTLTALWPHAAALGKRLV